MPYTKTTNLTTILLSILLLTNCSKNENRYAFPQGSQKIWAHASNTIEKATKAVDNFAGIELDIIYSSWKNTFEVRHNIEDSATILNLEDYLSSISNYDKMYFWFDFKNLTRKNTKAAGEKINEIFKKYNLYSRAFIESSNYACLSEMHKYSIATSYWIPYLKNRDSKAEKDSLYLIINDNLTKNNYTAISSTYLQYSFMKEYFPNQKINIWTTGLNGEKGIEQITEFAADKNTKTILVDFDKNYWN